MTVDTASSKHYYEGILSIVIATIQRYRLISPGQKVLVALSGGKDSLFATYILKELGYHVTPVIVDMGYEYGWSNRIMSIARNAGFEAYVIDVRGSIFQRTLLPEVQSDLAQRLIMLNSIQTTGNSNLTPCTQCYNVKHIVLSDFARKNDFEVIVFGHHATDAISSLLKSAFYYIDRWDYNHRTFLRHNFEKLVEDSSRYFLNGYGYFSESPILRRIDELVKIRAAATDEPPMQRVGASDANTKIVRPLYNIFEHTIKDFQEKWSLSTEGSGCGHGATKDTETPREIVHRRILTAMEDAPDRDSILTKLLSLSQVGLNEDGSLIVNTRNDRQRLLGFEYKSQDGCAKKL